MKSAIAVTLLAALVGAASSLHCYSCTHEKGQFDKDNCGTCVTEKSCYKKEGAINDDNAVIRGCALFKQGAGCDNIEVGGLEAASCYCNDDYCNGSSSQSPLRFLAPILAFALVAAWR